MPSKCELFFLVLTVLFGLLLRLLSDGNVFFPLVPHDHDQCEFVRQVSGVNASSATFTQRVFGAEDGAILNSIAYIGSDERSHHFNPDLMRKVTPQNQGAIFFVDLKHTQTHILHRLNIENMPKHITDFHPHGIQIKQSKDKLHTFLYVISHGPEADSIFILQVIFKQEDSRIPAALYCLGLIHNDSSFTALNDLDVLPPTQSLTHPQQYIHHIFASNWLGSVPGTPTALFELVAKRPWGSVVLCHTTTELHTSSDASNKQTDEGAPILTHSTCIKAIDGVAGPNGVAVSADLTTLYVTSCTKNHLLVYHLPAATEHRPQDKSNTVTTYNEQTLLLPVQHTTTIPLHSGVDNINIEEVTNDLYIGSHFVPLKFLTHSDKPSVNRAPSQVLRIIPTNEQQQNPEQRPAIHKLYHEVFPDAQVPNYIVDEVFLSDGITPPLSASSFAAYDTQTKKLVIGGVFDEGILICSQ